MEKKFFLLIKLIILIYIIIYNINIIVSIANKNNYYMIHFIYIFNTFQNYIN